jgi:hypothetical protein
VASLIEKNIATGYADEAGVPTGEFGVANAITLAEVLKMALQAAQENPSRLPPPRNESARGTWASAYVAKAEQLGLDVITPDRNIHEAASRGEVISIVLQVLKIPTQINETFIFRQFADLPDNHPYRGPILSAAVHGLLQGDVDENGIPASTVRPDDLINRAEVSKIIALVNELLR